MKKVNLKKLKYGVNNTVVVVFAIVFVLLLNIVAGLLEKKAPVLTLDLSDQSVAKISSETKAVLDGVDEKDVDIELIYLKGTSDANAQVMEILEQYDAHSDNVSVRVETFHKNPMLLSGYGIEATSEIEGSVLVATKDKKKVRVVSEKDMAITYNNSTVFLLENLLTNAIGVVASEGQMTVCFATGHNEVLGEMLVNLMTSENIATYQLDLSTGGVPEDVDLLVIMSPQTDYTVSEINVIDDYLLSGGNVVVNLPGAIVLPRLEEYVASWGVSVNNDILLEQDASGSYENSGMYFYPVAGEYDAVKSITGRILASNARSMTFTKTGDIEADVLLMTSENGYSLPIVDNDINKDNMKQGTFALAYRLEMPLNGSFETTAKMVVTTSAAVWGVAESMVTEFDYHVLYSLTEESFGNRDFVMNMLSDLYGESIQSIYIPVKARYVSILTMTEAQAVTMQRIFCFVLPAMVLLLGVAIWLKRRNK